MEHFAAFTLAQPGTIAEAVALHGGEAGARYVGGGTDLVPNIRRGIATPAKLIDLTGIAALIGMSIDRNGLTIGAGVPVARIAEDERVKRHFPAIAEAACQIAGPAHREVGTLGGNLCLDTRCVYYNQSEWWRQANDYCLKLKGDTCHVAPAGKFCFAAYSGDLAPALIAYEAKAVLRGPMGRRKIALNEMFRDDGMAHLALEPGEMLVRVEVPMPSEGSLSGYEKGRFRGSIDFPLAGVAAALALEGGKISRLRLVVTGTNPQPVLIRELDHLVGRPLDDVLFAEIEKAMRPQALPMKTTVAGSNYRRHLAPALAEKLLRRLSAAA